MQFLGMWEETGKKAGMGNTCILHTGRPESNRIVRLTCQPVVRRAAHCFSKTHKNTISKFKAIFLIMNVHPNNRNMKCLFIGSLSSRDNLRHKACGERWVQQYSLIACCFFSLCFFGWGEVAICCVFMDLRGSTIFRELENWLGTPQSGLS